MSDNLTADKIAATDETMSEPVDLHPTLETVAEDAEARMKARWLARDIAGIQRRMEEQRQHQLRAALESLRALKEPK